MFLAVDVGNTQIVTGLYVNQELSKTWRLASEPTRTEDEYRSLFLSLFHEAKIDLDAFQGCMICSVIPRLTQTLDAVFKQILGPRSMLLSHDLDLGVENKYQHPQDVGLDRLANAVGGIEKYGAPLILIDLGTATTFDIISADRAYLGGVILPGLEMSADSLFQKTSLLPRVSIEMPQSTIGRNTNDAINAGLMLGTVGAIDMIAQRIKQEINAPDCAIIATGGHAQAIAKLSEQIQRVDPDLTLDGIYHVWRRTRQS